MLLDEESDRRILTANILFTLSDDNQLSSIPSEIGKLTDLQELDFGKSYQICLQVWAAFEISIRSSTFDDSMISLRISTGANDFTSDPYPATGSPVPSATSNPSAEFAYSAFSLPTEIWQLTNLQTFRFRKNIPFVASLFQFSWDSQECTRLNCQSCTVMSCCVSYRDSFFTFFVFHQTKMNSRLSPQRLGS